MPFYSETLNVFDDTRCVLGESVRWDPENERVVWLDIKSKKILLKKCSQLKAEHVSFNEYPGALLFFEDNTLGLTYANGLFSLQKDNLANRMTFDCVDVTRTRMNDAKVDPFGNLVFGTMDLAEASPRGQLFRLTETGDLSILIDNVVICNGPAFSQSGEKMYFSDSVTGCVFSYDYSQGVFDEKSRKIFARFGEGVYPDGLTVDKQGRVYVACWGGAKIVCFDPGGAVVSELLLPADYVTSCCFGGKNLDTLYITTASDPTTSETGPKIGGGYTFMCKMDTVGLNEKRFSGLALGGT